MARDPKRAKKVQKKNRRRLAREKEMHLRLVGAGVSDDPETAPPDDLPDLPPPTAMERSMRSIFGGVGLGRRSKREKAQDLAYEAMEAPDAKTAGRLALEAVRLDPQCTDALHLLAELTSRTADEFIESLRKAVAGAEKSLGDRFFKENRGDFWGLLETRPYMRARASLAQALRERGETDEAVKHYEEMLELNPNDNQGLRDLLVGLYLERGETQGAQRLFEQYSEDGSAVFSWARVLERFLSGDETGARHALKDARESNRYVAAYLTGRKKPPKESPDYYSPGRESEAVVCVQCIGGAWSRHDEAARWLKRAMA